MSMSLKKKVRELTADDVSQGTDITALKTTVGDNTKGLVKDTADLKTAVGDNSSGLVKKANDLETAIGDEDTASSILGRIKKLEDAQPSGEE